MKKHKKPIIYFLTQNGIRLAQMERTAYGARIAAFQQFFLNGNFDVVTAKLPDRKRDLFRAMLSLRRSAPSVVFISVPPFSALLFSIMTRTKVVLDFRDGWSVAISRGYGGLVKPRPIRAWLSKMIEIWVIKRAFKVITCTRGLKDYLEKISRTKVLLIRNGVSRGDIEIVNEIKSRPPGPKSDELRVVCAGKFAEYGEHRARHLVQTLVEKYRERRMKLTLIGSDVCANAGVVDYIKTHHSQIEVVFTERLARPDLLKMIHESDVGLLLVRDEEYEYGTKVYDYLLCNIPIISNVTKESDLYHLIAEVEEGRAKIDRMELIDEQRANLLGGLTW